MSNQTEHNLNEMLNTEEINESSDNTNVETSEANETLPITDPVDETSKPTTEEEGSAYTNLNDYITTHSDKISGANLTNLSFSRIPSGKYMMFVTSDESDAEVILFDKPNTFWIDSNVVPDDINVKNSGIVIKAPNHRYYVGKNNVTRIDINENNSVESIKVIGRAKPNAEVKVSDAEVTQNDADVDTIKLHAKRVSPKLYNTVKDLTTKEEIKDVVYSFMSKIHDLNHLIKIEKEILFALSL